MAATATPAFGAKVLSLRFSQCMQVTTCYGCINTFGNVLRDVVQWPVRDLIFETLNKDSFQTPIFSRLCRVEFHDAPQITQCAQVREKSPVTRLPNKPRNRTVSSRNFNRHLGLHITNLLGVIIAATVCGLLHRQRVHCWSAPTCELPIH